MNSHPGPATLKDSKRQGVNMKVTGLFKYSQYHDGRLYLLASQINDEPTRL